MTTAVCAWGGGGWGRTHNDPFSQRSTGPGHLLPLPPSSALFLTGSLCLVQEVWEGGGEGGRERGRLSLHH